MKFARIVFLVAGVWGLTIVTPLYFLFLGTTLFALLAFLLVILIYIKHGPNIVRLIRGEEPMIGRGG